MGLAMGIDWRLSFLAPVLALSFLGSEAARPTLRTAVGLVAIVAAASLVGLGLSAWLLPYPEVFLLLEGLMLFLLFFWGARGGPGLLITLLLLAITVIPLVALQAMVLATATAQGLVAGAAAAVFAVWLSHVLVPDPATPPPVAGASSAHEAPAPADDAESAEGSELPSRTRAAAAALVKTAVVFPLVFLYFVLGLTSVVVLVFVALLSMQTRIDAGFKAGRALIVGNVMGGLAAVLMYELLVMVPEFGFLLLLTLLAGLFFGGKLFSGAPSAPLFGMAYSTLILVIGSTTSMFGDAGAKAWTRVIQITVAVVYLGVAFGLVDRLRRGREARRATA